MKGRFQSMQPVQRLARRRLRPSRHASTTADTEGSPAEALQRCVEARASTADVLTLQRSLGNAMVARMIGQQVARAPEGSNPGQVKLDPRAIFDDLHLQSEFWGSAKDPGSRLDTAFHNNRPLTAADNGDDVERLQSALEAVGENVIGGVDGQWGGGTTRTVASFQSKNGIPPGGFEAGRKTLLALDAHLQNVTPNQKRIPVVHLKPDGGPEASASQPGLMYQIDVDGDDFARRSGDNPSVNSVAFEGTEAAVEVPDDNGHFKTTIVVPARAAGTFNVTASSNGERASAPFTVPAPTNPSDPNQLNPSLESTMDEILLAYQGMLLQQLEGLLELERDLRAEPEHEKKAIGYVIEIVKAATERSIEGLLNVGIGRLLLLVQNELKVKQPNSPTDAPGVADVFGEIQNIALDQVKKFLGVDDLPLDKPRQPALNKFIDAQRDWVTRTTVAHERHFIDVTKPAIRKRGGQPRTPGADPRVEYATDVLGSVRDGAQQAKAAQYDTSAEQWATAEAQVTVGQRTNPDTSDVVTDLSKDDAGNGVFIIEVNAGAPTNTAPLVKEVRVEGLTEKVRKHLENSDRPLSELGARRIEADTTDPSASVTVSKNEENEVFVNSDSTNSRNWLLKKDAASGSGGTNTVQGGALALFDEIEKGAQRTLKKAGGLKL